MRGLTVSICQGIGIAPHAEDLWAEFHALGKKLHPRFVRRWYRGASSVEGCSPMSGADRTSGKWKRKYDRSPKNPSVLPIDKRDKPCAMRAALNDRLRRVFLQSCQEVTDLLCERTASSIAYSVAKSRLPRDTIAPRHVAPRMECVLQNEPIMATRQRCTQERN